MRKQVDEATDEAALQLNKAEKRAKILNGYDEQKVRGNAENQELDGACLLEVMQKLADLHLAEPDNFGVQTAFNNLKGVLVKLDRLEPEADFSNDLNNEVNAADKEAIHQIEAAAERAITKKRIEQQEQRKQSGLKVSDISVSKATIPKAGSLQALKSSLESLDTEYNVSNELAKLNKVIERLKDGRELTLDEGKALQKDVNQAENHLHYVNYIQNIERTVKELEFHLEFHIAGSSDDSLLDEVTALENELTDFKRKPLNTLKDDSGKVIEEGKMDSIGAFKNNMVDRLNVLNDKMRGSEHRKVLKPLIKHVLLAVLVFPTAPAVIASLIYRVAKGKFLFFESKQKQVNNVYKSLKNAPPVPGEPERPQMR